jgi:hypothetical protein
MYINKSNRVGMGLDAQFTAIRVVWEGGGNKENRKMFSHRERGFPTRRGSKNGNSKVIFREGRLRQIAIWLRSCKLRFAFSDQQDSSHEKAQLLELSRETDHRPMGITSTRVDVSGCDLHP